MPTPPYAKATVTRNGGSVESGYVVATDGDVVQLLIENPSGVTQYRWEITDYPPDWSLPSGWQEASDGTYYSVASAPPTFTVDEWGKWTVSLTVQGRKSTDPITWLDRSLMIEVVGPNGIFDVTHMEAQQKDLRGWIVDLRRNMRTLSSGSGSVIESANLGLCTVANVVGTGNTNVRQRAMVMQAPRGSALPFRYVRAFMTNAPSANESFVARIYTRTSGGGLYTTTSPNFTQVAASSALVIGSATPVGIVEMDLGSTVTIAAGTTFWVGLSATGSGSITAANFASASITVTTNYIGGGWTYAPGSATDYTGGALSASVPSANYWVELAA
jgi:hypothetical protein